MYANVVYCCPTRIQLLVRLIFHVSDSGLCEMIEALLSKGADVDLFSYCGTPLHAAIIGKQDAAVKILLDNHADVSIFVLRLVCDFVLFDRLYL